MNIFGPSYVTLIINRNADGWIAPSYEGRLKLIATKEKDNWLCLNCIENGGEGREGPPKTLLKNVKHGNSVGVSLFCCFGAQSLPSSQLL